MLLTTLNRGVLASNTYIISSNKVAVIVDPGNNTEDILSVINEQNLTVKYIILTHCHFDHILYLDDIRAKTNAVVVAHKLEKPGFQDPLFNGSALIMGRPMVFKEPDILVDEGDILDAGDMKLEFIHTPGHSPGSMCIKVGTMLFTGDTIFDGAFGRTDFPSGEPSKMKASVDKVYKLNSEIMVYPGHETSDSLGEIIKKNRVAYKYL